MSQLEIKPVNKYEEPWNPDVMFSGFTVRVVIHKSNDVITNIQNMSNLKRKLGRELGREDVDWLMQENPITGENELYLKSTAKLIMWRLQDNMKFMEMFELIEQHTPDQSTIDQWHSDQEEKARVADEAAEAERQAAIQAMIDANRPPDQMPPGFGQEAP